MPLQHQLVHVIIIILMGIGLSLLYVQSKQFSMNSLHQFKTKVHDLSMQDEIIENDMVQLVTGRLHHFDTLVSGMANLASIQAELGQMVAKTGEDFSAWSKLQESLQTQQEPMETFKMEVAIYRNSLLYLPALMDEINRTYPQYQAVLLSIYQQLLHLTFRSQAFDTVKLQALLDKTKGEDPLANIRKHLSMLLIQTQKVESSMQRFIGCGVEEAVDSLSMQYAHWFDEKIQDVNMYRKLLLWAAMLMLVYIVFVVWSLRKTSKSLKKAYQFSQSLQKAVDEHAIVSITNQRGDITYANDKVCVISGYTRDELIGQNHRVLKSDEHDDVFFEHMWASLVRGEVWKGVIKNKRKNGSFYWVDTTITPFLNSKGKPWQYVSVRTDITHLVEMEKRLKESAQRYQALFQMMPFGLGIVQGKTWAYVNQALVHILDSKSETFLLGKSVFDTVQFSDQEQLMRGLEKACETQVAMDAVELELVTLSGHPVAVEVQAIPLVWQGVKAMLIAMQDISERKQQESEKRHIQENLEQQQRLESLGILAGGIAHDFNNMLTGIMGNAALARHDVGQSGQTYLDKVSRISERAAELCQHLLMYSGGGQIEKKPLLLSDLVDDVVAMVTTTMRDQIELKLIVAKDLPLIEVDVRQFQQIVLNLLTNARDAITGSGSITIELGVKAIQGSCAWVNDAKIPDGEYVFIRVTDTGCGMDEATQAKVFEPFFTTKVTGRGLGMSAILGIVQTHDGAISMKSIAGQGTSICVVTPVAYGAVLEEKQTPALTTMGEASGMILLIDDEPSILELAQFVLEEAGFEVVTAEDGEQGIQQFEAHKDKLVAVLCDMVMPKLGGAEVANYIYQAAPNLPILLSSGYDRDTLSHVNQQAITAIIQKPYLPDDLVEEILKVLH